MSTSEEVEEKVEAIEHEPEVLENDGKLNRLMEGMTHSFAGNASLMQYYQIGFYENRLEPTKIALYDDESERTVTFKELDVLSSKLALVIKNRLGPQLVNQNPDGDIVFGVCAPPTDRLIILIFAIMKLGGAYVPFDVSFPESRVVRIVDVSKPIMIISDSIDTTLSKFDAVKYKTKIVTLEELIIQIDTTVISSTYVSPLPSPIEAQKFANRTAIVLFTSGSSGEPKGVRLSHKTILNRLNWQWHMLPFAASESCCFKTALTFVDSVPEIFGPLLQGRHVVVLSKSMVTQSHIFVQKIQEHKISRLTVVPSFLSNLLSLMDVLADRNSKLTALDTIKIWVCSGETLTRNLLERFFDNFKTGSTTIYNFYGSTEIMGDVTYESFASLKDVDAKCVGPRVPLGQPIFNTVIYILSDKMEMVPEGHVGEIILAGYNLAKGYVGIRDSDKFIFNLFSKTPGFNRLYRTGDYGRIQAMTNGRRALFYDGRVDSQIKVRGHRVDLSEIETVINGLTLVKKCVVLCYHVGEPDQTILAFCIPDNEGTKDRIVFTLKLKLMPYQMPKIRVIREIPHLVNGKVDRQRLLWDYHEERAKLPEFNDWEKLDISKDKLPSFRVLIQTISKVTGTSVHDIVQDLDDSFYNLGGTSLNSIMVISELRKFDYNISIHDFVAAKTIRELHKSMKFNDDGVGAKALAESTKIGLDARKKLTPEILEDAHKAEVIHIISASFAHKGDLESYVHVTMPDFEEMLNSVWTKLVEAEYSFVVRRKTDNKIIAACLNFDAYDEPDDAVTSEGLQIIFDFLEFMEAPVREKLPQGKGKLMHNFMMGTHEDLSNAENVYMIEFMEEENIRLGSFHNFIGLFTTNTSALTQQIGLDIQGYTSLAELQLNQYVTAGGQKPFLLAPDDKKAYVCWKKIDPTQ